MLHTRDVRAQLARTAREPLRDLDAYRAKMEAKQAWMVERHRRDRCALDDGRAVRWSPESADRTRPFRSRRSGLWQGAMGQHRPLQEQYARGIPCLTVEWLDPRIWQWQRVVLVGRALVQRSRHAEE